LNNEGNFILKYSNQKTVSFVSYVRYDIDFDICSFQGLTFEAFYKMKR